MIDEAIIRVTREKFPDLNDDDMACVIDVIEGASHATPITEDDDGVS